MQLDLPLVDAHCHTVVTDSPDRAAFELMLGEADRPAPEGVSYADSLLGLAVRRWCAPILDLSPGTGLDDYLARRESFGPEEVGRRLLGAAGLSHLLVDTGLGSADGQAEPGGGGRFWSLGTLAAASSADVREVVRLESVAERLADSGVDADDFAQAYVEALRAATREAVGVKSILAYRYGFEIDLSRPSPDEVTLAARGWLDSLRGSGAAPGAAAGAGRQVRLDDPVLLRFVLWCGVDRGLPVQVHTGFGDRDLRLPRVNPALLQPFFEAVEPTGTPIVLLHCYPYQRQAGWLAAVYPNVYVDVGLTVSHVGARAQAVLAEFCELAPFGKLLFSTDAYRLPELYAVGVAQFRHAFGALLSTWRHEGAMSAKDAERFARLVGSENARRLYSL
ncbi:amidohydrolase family protein [Actinopolymorpha pittospori]